MAAFMHFYSMTRDEYFALKVGERNAMVEFINEVNRGA